MMSLNEEQKRHLRRLGHALSPVVRTGNAGLTEAVLAEVELALEHHELIKVKLVAGDRDERQEFLGRIVEVTRATPVQTIGQIALLYRPNPKKKGQRVALP
jgi:RNA-binding protein